MRLNFISRVQAWRARMAANAIDIAGLKTRLAKAESELAEWPARLAGEIAAPRAKSDPLADLPYIPPNITDRHDIGRRILRDEIERPSYAFSVWLATVQAAKLGIRRLHVIEFGVAYAAGLESLCRICEMITASTDIEFEITGFDSDVGMPPLTDYRDHPEIWFGGQFLSDHNAIRDRLPANARLISGEIGVTLPAFIHERTRPECPIGFVSVDVDLYSSAVACFELFRHPDPARYLPTTIVYMDDVNDLLTCNDWCGEALAIREFNQAHEMRKLQELRIRQNHPPAGWHDHVYGLHVLDHPVRQHVTPGVELSINITAM